MSHYLSQMDWLNAGVRLAALISLAAMLYLLWPRKKVAQENQLRGKYQSDSFGKEYDPEFDKAIRKLKPHWFKAKRQLLTMARNGSS